MLFDKLWQNGQKWYWSVIGWICFIRKFWKRNHFGFFKPRRKKIISMHKLKTYVSESIMYGNDSFSSWLLISSWPDDFLSSLDMYLPSYETERYGMTNGSCPLGFCLQKSCRGFERSYTFIVGSVNIWNIFLSLVCLSLPLFPSCLC